MTHPFQSPAIEAAFAAFPSAKRQALLDIRTMIFDIAATLPVGPVEETLKWGQPSYSTPQTKAATPIRLSVTKKGDVGVFTHCQSSVMSDFQALAPPDLRFDGNRALLLDAAALPAPDQIAPLINAALTYRL